MNGERDIFVSEQEKEEKNNEASNDALELSAFYGIKAGMTRIFGKNGNHVPVTVIKLVTNRVTQVKTLDKDGYEAYQIAYGEKRAKLLNCPTKGRLTKAKVEENFSQFREIRATGVNVEHLGSKVVVTDFAPDTWVDVTGTSKGKGFQGVIKRHNFSQGPMAHGSKFHRTGGSIGNRATPGKVWKNKKMPGRMGFVTKTVQNLKVIEVDQEKGYMLIRGAVPGCKNSYVRITRAVKK